MKISYDKIADAMYIELVEGIDQVRTVMLSEDISIDFGKGEILESNLFKIKSYQS